MTRATPLLTLLLLACSGGKGDPLVDTELEDTEPVVDSEPADTEDTELVDTEPPAEPTVWTAPAIAATELGGASMDFGVYARYQQLVPASLMPADAVEIVELRLRRSGAKGADQQTTTLPSVEIWLGTAAGTALADAFADNLTGDEQQVFNEAVTLGVASGDGLLFDDLVVTVDPPFAYDPAGGPLLLDLRVPTLHNNVLFDCKNDGTMPVVMSSAAGTPTERNNLSGCGMVVQLLVR